MNQLLLAESTFQRQSKALAGVKGVDWVTLGENGVIRLNGVVTDPASLSLSMARLDMELFLAAPEVVPGLISSVKRFSFVQTAAAGLDDPMLQAIVRNTEVFCNSDAQSPAIAEFVFASVLNRWHRFDVRAAHQQARRWQDNHFHQVCDSHWLIIGYGNIGQRVARLASAGDARVTGVRRSPAPDELAEQVIPLSEVHRQLPDADVVVLACALNDETRGLADEAFFKAINPGAVLVNIGRGDLVDEPALLAALDHGQLDFAVLDVFATEPLPESSRIWDHERIQVTPHASHRGYRTDSRFDDLFLANLTRYLAGEPVTNRVDPATL